MNPIAPFSMLSGAGSGKAVAVLAVLIAIAIAVKTTQQTPTNQRSQG